MNNYLVFFLVGMLYTQISVLLSTMTSPRSAFGVYFQLCSQFILLAIVCLTPIWWPINTVTGWVAWCLFCLLMYFCLALQIGGAFDCVIKKDKIYDCLIINKYALPDGTKFVLGQIKEGGFVTKVVIMGTMAEKKGSAISVVYKKHFQPQMEVKVFDEETKKFVKRAFSICVIKVDEHGNPC